MVSEMMAQEMPQEMLMLLLFVGTATILPTLLSGAAGYQIMLNQLIGRLPVVTCTVGVLKQVACVISEIRRHPITRLPNTSSVAWTAMNRMVLQMRTCLEQR